LIFISENQKYINRKGDHMITFSIFGALNPIIIGQMLHRCIKSVDGIIYVKNGKTKQGKQRYKCKQCGQTFLKKYSNKACLDKLNIWIVKLIKEGNGIRSISRLLEISSTTVLSRVVQLAKNIQKPSIVKGKMYELDELCSYIQHKENRIWIAYALRKDTREVVDFVVGRRTNKTLKCITNTLILSEAKRINTDKLRNYRSLIPRSIHKTKQFGTNHIERMNLTLRTHLKRLNRRTICFSKKQKYLEAHLRIYFWG